MRDIDSTAKKEEVDSDAEVINAPLKMIAHVSSNVPNILLHNPQFASYVNTDLTLAYRNAVDAHCIDEISNAGIPALSGSGANIFEDVLYAVEAVAEAGYSADIAVMSPGDGLRLRLLMLHDGSSYALPISVGMLPRVIASPGVQDGEGFVADAQALGVLFVGAMQFGTWEENAGTNTSTVRAESSGIFVPQRVDAAAYLSGTS